MGGGKGVPTQFLNGLDLKKWERFPGGGENTLFLKTTLFLPLIHSQSPIPEPPARKEIRGEAVELAEVLNKSVGQPSPAAGPGPRADKKKDTLSPVVVSTRHVTICTGEQRQMREVLPSMTLRRGWGDRGDWGQQGWGGVGRGPEGALDHLACASGRVMGSDNQALNFISKVPSKL